MDNLGKAYLWSVIFSISAPIASLYNTVVAVILVLLHVFVVGSFIANDATSRGKSKAHQVWSILGLIGVIIYHLIFARE